MDVHRVAPVRQAECPWNCDRNGCGARHDHTCIRIHRAEGPLKQCFVTGPPVSAVERGGKGLPAVYYSTCDPGASKRCGGRRTGCKYLREARGQIPAAGPECYSRCRAYGKKVGGGNQAEASDHVFLTLTRHADGLGYVLQFGTASGHGSDTIHYDTSIEPTITMPTNGSLSIEGPTSIFRFEERTRDGHVSKTRELLIN